MQKNLSQIPKAQSEVVKYLVLSNTQSTTKRLQEVMDFIRQNKAANPHN